MLNFRFAAALGGLFAVAGCATTTQWDQASAERFRADVETLASDAYEGREAGTPGYDLAVEYVAASFKKIGLKPAGDAGYLQQVPLRRAYAMPKDGAMAFVNSEASAEEALTPLTDFFMGNSVTQADVAVSGEVVFVGYGMDAPMFGQTAYRDLDVRGKIVAMVQGTPEGLPSEERAHFGSGRTKRDTAAKYGAVGVINLSDTRGANAAGRARLAQYFATATNMVVHPEGRHPTVEAYAMMTKAGTAKLLAAAGVDGAALFAGDVAPGPMGVSVDMSSTTRFEDYQSPNVVGMIEGSHPALKDEYVVLTAHLDHVGKLKSVQADKDLINNGAMDNASGTATLLEEARKFMSGDAPRRSVLFVALTAEEKGLLGSEYFAQNPTVPASGMVANVNLDMPILLHEFTDVIAFGAQHSSLKATTAQAAGSMGVTLVPDPVPHMALFVRSDHYNFVKVGVPSVFLFLGFDNGGEASFQNFMATTYHKPSDQPDLPIMYDMAAKFAELNYRIAKEIANADDKPSWNDDSVFGTLFSPADTGM